MNITINVPMNVTVPTGYVNTRAPEIPAVSTYSISLVPPVPLLGCSLRSVVPPNSMASCPTLIISLHLSCVLDPNHYINFIYTLGYPRDPRRDCPARICSLSPPLSIYRSKACISYFVNLTQCPAGLVRFFPALPPELSDP